MSAMEVPTRAETTAGTVHLNQIVRGPTLGGGRVGERDSRERAYVVVEITPNGGVIVSDLAFRWLDDDTPHSPMLIHDDRWAGGGSGGRFYPVTADDGTPVWGH